MREEIAWAFMGSVVLAYLAQRHVAKEKVIKTPPIPSAETEVDPTRWRHDGTQRVRDKVGNRRALGGMEFAEVHMLMGSLGY